MTRLDRRGFLTGAQADWHGPDMASAPSSNPAELTEVARIALASARTSERELWWTLFALDAQLARIVRTSREPLLAQVRLSWWREELAKPPEKRVVGNAILDCAGRSWRGDESALAALVDGWEQLLGEPPLAPAAMQGFARGRGMACGAVAGALQIDDAEAWAIAGKRWAYAEMAAHSRDRKERAQALDLARSLPESIYPRPRNLRPLAIIEGLARRSVARGGKPLVGDRLSPFVALRLGILGR